MVGLFSGSNNMDKKEDHQVGGEKDEENETKNLLHFDDDVDDDDVDDDGSVDDEDEDEDGEFKPIEHPLEPPEDDQPAKWPAMPDLSKLSFIYDDSAEEEPFTENQQKRAVSLVSNEVDLKKHHKHAQDSANPIQFRGQQYNIFEVFNQCKEFGFS